MSAEPATGCRTGDRGLPLTTRQYWDASRTAFQPTRVESSEFAPYFRRYLPVDASKTCVEIGAYPGTHLCYLARRFGYAVTGIEYSDRWRDLEEQFRFNGVQRGEVIHADFSTMPLSPRFDVVTSFGFIEHFAEPDVIVERHFQLLRAGGFLVVSVPYLGGLQGWLRRAAYTGEKMQAVLATHNQAIMHRDALVSRVRRGGDVLFADYVMGARVWFNARDPGVRTDRRWLVGAAGICDRLTSGWLPSSRYYSPMILVIAAKRARLRAGAGPGRP